MWALLSPEILHAGAVKGAWSKCVGSNPLGHWLLGDSGGVVNSLDICPASLNPLAAFTSCAYTFFTKDGGDSEFANFTLPTLKAFLEARSQNVSGNKQ